MAHACGGTFCDAGPQSMPVDQTGENILFVMEEDAVEAHIQIQYDPNTEADQFAWLVPILTVPQFSVGSDRLFDNLLLATVPSYGYNTVGGCGGGGTGTGEESGGWDDGGTDTGGPDPDPEVLLEETVGAFDIVVLQGGNAQTVMDWLGANGYQQDPNAEPILGEYLDEGYLFAAFKLTNGADVDEIHPVVLRFDPQSEACVPIRLTRIAAVEDMEVRTFFLSENRVVPRNYRHVLVNPLKLNWLNFASNYKEVITMAVDNAVAKSRAFVTEYAASSGVVSKVGVFSFEWDSSAFMGMSAVDVVDTLTAQGLLSCELGECMYSHTLIRGLLNQYVPVPNGLEEGEFYGCLGCYQGLIDQGAWDDVAFADAVETRIVDPGRHAFDLLDTWPFLTRMYTTISPAEMTEDPFFWQNPDLPDVDLRNEMGTYDQRCDDIGEVFTLPDNRSVYLPNSQWPPFNDQMPWVEDVEQVPAAGPPIGLLDNSELIDQELRDWNCAWDFPSVEYCRNAGTDTGTTGGEDTGDSSGGPDGTTTGADGGQDDDGANTSGGSGCGCRSSSHGMGSIMVIGLVLGALRRRRTSVERVG